MIYGALSLFAVSMMAFAQDEPSDAPQNPQPTTTQNPQPTTTTQNPQPTIRRRIHNRRRRDGIDSLPHPRKQRHPMAPAPQADPAPAAVPAQITIPAGTFVTVRVDQFLSSDKNKAGDGFSATLSRPLVADGLVVSRRGETLGGHVVDAKKAGRVKGVSHLQITLNTLTLADGQQIPDPDGVDEHHRPHFQRA